MELKKYPATFDISEIAELFNIKGLTEKLYFRISISTDSRSVKRNQIFLPLIGKNLNGHDYINDVFKRANSEQPFISFCEKSQINKVKKEYRKKLIIVKSTLDAYHKIAQHYRKKINPRVVAITGSSGKTTVKDLLSGVLSSRYKVYKTEANNNNEIGVPKTILEMPESTEILILELAMRGKGEIRYLSKTANPDVAIVTNVGSAHIGRLGSLQKLIRAKSEILEHLKKNGLAVVNNNPTILKQVQKIWKGKTAAFDLSQASEISFEDGKTNFSINIKGLMYEKFYLNLPGINQIENALLAILIAKYFGLSKNEIQRGLSSFRIPEGRGVVNKIGRESFVIDDCYNANPESVKSSVNNLISCWKNGYRKVVVLGELAELGSYEKRLLGDLARWIEKQSITHVITVGKKVSKYFKSSNVKKARNIKDCCAILEKILNPHTIILVKGSRIAGLEQVVKFLTVQQNEGNK